MQPTITAEYLASQGLSKKFEKRFWAKVSKDGPIHPYHPHLGHCWRWLASVNQWGYGRIGAAGTRNFLAHRGSWILHCGPIPKGLLVLHSCDRPACTNPAHLFLGTDDDNNRDMVKKGRQELLCGVKNGNSKLTWEAVKEIRRLYQLGVSQMDLGRRFGVEHSCIWFVVHEYSWKAQTFKTQIAPSQ